MGSLKVAEGGGVVWVWIKQLGREVGSGVEAAVFELRICTEVLWTVRSLEWSYSEKSMAEFMAWVYKLLAVVNLKMLLSWMASWNMVVRVEIW